MAGGGRVPPAVSVSRGSTLPLRSLRLAGPPATCVTGNGWQHQAWRPTRGRPSPCLAVIRRRILHARVTLVDSDASRWPLIERTLPIIPERSHCGWPHLYRSDGLCNGVDLLRLELKLVRPIACAAMWRSPARLDRTIAPLGFLTAPLTMTLCRCFRMLLAARRGPPELSEVGADKGRQRQSESVDAVMLVPCTWLPSRAPRHLCVPLCQATHGNPTTHGSRCSGNRGSRCSGNGQPRLQANLSVKEPFEAECRKKRAAPIPSMQRASPHR
jgi:hypothetical protein